MMPKPTTKDGLPRALQKRGPTESHSQTALDDDVTGDIDKLRSLALKWLRKQQWARGISVSEAELGLCVPGVVAVFAVRFRRAKGRQSLGRVWLVCGDVPIAAFVDDGTPTATAALRWYCVLMKRWCAAVRDGRDLATAYPVEAAPTVANARALESRVQFLRTRVIPRFERKQVTVIM
jgi:hypothetical protein